MSLSKFICPDGERIGCVECIEQCRLAQRCVSLATLRAIHETERMWDGTPHVTDLLNGPMLNWLKIVEEYAVEPQSRAFALLGSTHHKMLEGTTQHPAEIKVEVMGIVGSADGIEPAVGGDGLWNLIDLKTWGSYKVAKALGMMEIGKMPDPSGARYSRGGKWGGAGAPKMVSRWEANPARADLAHEIIQLNFYRIGLEAQDLAIQDMMIQATVRDGGTHTAKGYGIDRLIYMIPVPRVADGQVMLYLIDKKMELEIAIKTDDPRLCDDTECWSGRRCMGYCDVAEFCPRGKELK